MNYPFKFAGQPEPQLTYGPLRDWGGLTARRVRATPGRYPGGGAAHHQLVVYMTPDVVSDCSCDGGVHSRRVGRTWDFDFVPAGAIGFWEDQAAMEMIGLRLAPSMLSETAEALELKAGDLEPRLGARDLLVEHIARALDAELDAPEPAGRLYADSLAIALSTRLLQNFAPAAPGRQILSKAQIRRFVEYVEEHLDSDLTLAELAEVVGLSVPHMTTLFRRTMGQTVHGYVMERRVCRARALLLLGGRGGIADVALEAGFAHQSHLARWMRRLLGVTPSELARLRS